MTVLLVFGLFIVIVTAHNIANLEVPQYGDPRMEAKLECFYISEKGDPALHSVKWYRDSYEIFRFTPGQMPTTRTFNTTAGREVTKGSCNSRNCYIHVRLPWPYNTTVSYTCEVSTEGPRFAVVKQTKNLTVAVVMYEDPVISGVPTSVQLGEDVLLNCSTSYVHPAPDIKWYIDGIPEKVDLWTDSRTEKSRPDFDGLRASWKPLRLRVSSAKGYVTVRCEASQPTRPAYVRYKNANLIVARSPHLSMFTASGSSMMETTTLTLVACVYLLFLYTVP